MNRRTLSSAAPRRIARVLFLILMLALPAVAQAGMGATRDRAPAQWTGLVKLSAQVFDDAASPGDPGVSDARGSSAAGSAASDGAHASRASAAAEGQGGGASTNRGDLLWEDRLDLSGFEQAFAAAALKARVFVAGFVSSPGSFVRDFLVRAYDTRTGVLLWQDRVDKAGRGDFASAAVTDDERLFVSGNSDIPGRGRDWVVRAYDPETGGLLWEDVFDLAGGFDQTQRRALAVEQGLLYVGGSATNASGNGDGIVRAYNASSGALVWQDRFDLGGQRFGDQARTFAVKAGRLFVGGFGSTPASDDIVVRTYNARTGALVWQHSTPGFPGAGFTFAGRVVAQGDRVLVGSTLETPSPDEIPRNEFLLQAHDAESGALLWQDRVGHGSQVDFLTDVAALGGRVFGFGWGGSGCLPVPEPTDCDTFVRSYDAETGTLLWERQFDLSGLDDFSQSVAAENATVFLSSVAAQTRPDGGEWLIQALDSSTGRLQWESAGGSVELPLDVAPHRGRLFVPGRSVDPTTDDWDFIVRAYDAQGPR